MNKWHEWNYTKPHTHTVHVSILRIIHNSYKEKLIRARFGFAWKIGIRRNPHYVRAIRNRTQGVGEKWVKNMSFHNGELKNLPWTSREDSALSFLRQVEASSTDDFQGCCTPPSPQSLSDPPRTKRGIPRWRPAWWCPARQAQRTPMIAWGWLSLGNDARRTYWHPRSRRICESLSDEKADSWRMTQERFHSEGALQSGWGPEKVAMVRSVYRPRIS